MPRKAKESIFSGIVPVGTELGEGDTIVTYSELDTFRQCPLKHRWAYELLMTKEQGVGSLLAKGTLWHLVMETYYYTLATSTATPEQAAEYAAQRHLLDDQGEFISADAELISWMLEGYISHYGDDPGWEVLAVELSGMHPLGLVHSSTPPSGPQIWLQYKIDMLVKDVSGRIWIVDHKTASAFSQQTEIDLDDQFGLYTSALRLAGIPVFGFIRSDARTQRNKGPMKLEDRFRRVPTHRTDIELRNIREDALATARLMRAERPANVSSPDPRQCVWKCDFLQAHLMYRKTDRAKRSELDILEGFGFAPRELRHREYEANYPPLA